MAIKKFLGRDCELSTTGTSAGGSVIDSWAVTRAVLREIGPALEQRGAHCWPTENRGDFYASASSMDCLRHWTSAGQCFYSDMAHVEVCTAETADPLEFAAQSLGVLTVAEAARRAAQERSTGARFALASSNADARDPAVSWGSHLSVSIDSELWDDLFVEHLRPTRLAYVASAIAAGIAFFGAGYLLPLKDGSTLYSLSARAHHLAKVHTLSTTQPFQRGILNSRREPHGKTRQRLHLIGFDFALGSAALLATYVQCVLAAAEEGFCGLALYDPVRALRTWSWSIDRTTGRLPGCAMLVDGRHVTLPEYVRELATTLLGMCDGGLISEGVAPRASSLLPRIVALTHYAEEGNLPRCARHLDWAAKLLCLVGSDQPWGSPASRLMDHDYGNTDPARGTFWGLWERGLVDPLVERRDVEAATLCAPEASRAWARGRIIERFGEAIADVDWDHIDLETDRDRWSPRIRISLAQLDGLTKSRFAPLCDQARNVAHLAKLVERRSRGSAEWTDPVTDLPFQLATVGNES